MRKSKIFICFFATLTCVSVLSYLKINSNNVEPPSVLGELYHLDSKNGNWKGIPANEKMEDFAYLCEQLIENYPFIDMMKRTQDINFEEVCNDYRNRISQCNTDFQFFVTINMFLMELDNTGHLNLITPDALEWYRNAYKNTAFMNKEDTIRANRLNATFNDELVVECYSKMDAQHSKTYEDVQKYYMNLEGEDFSQNEIVNEYSNLELKILKENEIAYIKINSFLNDYYEQDKKLLFNFYEKVKDYDNVIFDITDNSGGAMSYFDDLVVAPNISEDMVLNAYELTKKGSINAAYLDFQHYRPITELPNTLIELEEEDIKNLDIFRTIEYVVSPLYKSKKLHGNIWLLTSENVYSSSEYAAIFAKSTGFAKLVGEITSGDGIGEDPLPLVLPNSHLVILYSAIYGVTDTGKCSVGNGTIPDIICDAEVALETCLEEIKRDN